MGEKHFDLIGCIQIPKKNNNILFCFFHSGLLQLIAFLQLLHLTPLQISADYRSQSEEGFGGRVIPYSLLE